MLEIYQQDCFTGIPEKLQFESIDLILTSPPFNSGNAKMYNIYKDNKEMFDYLRFLTDSVHLFEKYLLKGGHLIINLPSSVGTKDEKIPRIPYKSMFLTLMFQLQLQANTNLIYRGEKIWWKQNASSNDMAIGSKANKPTFADDYEILLLFRNGLEDRHGVKGSSPDSEMKRNMVNSWILSPDPIIIPPEMERALREKHKALFPVKLAKIIIDVFTRKNELVVDPFAGLGSTGVACALKERNFIGFELEKEWCEIAEIRMKYPDDNLRKVEKKVREKRSY